VLAIRVLSAALIASSLGLSAANADVGASATECKTWFSRKVHKASAFQEAGPASIAAVQAMGGCTAENEPYHGTGLDFVIGGKKIGVSLRSIDFPELFEALEPALKARAESSLSHEDREFALSQLLPILEDAVGEDDEDLQEKFIQKARALWKDHLVPPAKQQALAQARAQAAEASAAAAAATPSAN
jgi:hypothetical protein